MSVVIADYSEFQGVVHPNNQQVVIIRAHNGWRADNDWAANRQAAHDAGCKAVGIYQYLPQSVDAATASNELCALVGTLASNEWLICDLEEGSGNEQPRWQAWDTAAKGHFNRLNWLYSGAAFSTAHDLHPDWVAAYQWSEPTGNFKLWQNTDNYPWPWSKGDASIFNGTIGQFLAEAGVTNEAVNAVPPAQTPNPVSIGNKAVAGTTIDGGHELTSDNGWRAVMQNDGNFVIYDTTNAAKWQSGSSGHNGAVAVMQWDGNLVVYAPGGVAVWSSGTQNHHGYWAIQQDDGNLVIYGGNPQAAVWQSGTH